MVARHWGWEGLRAHYPNGVFGGCQAAQEMGHLSLLELMAACGHFSPLLSSRSWEWEERGEKERGEWRGMGEGGGEEGKEQEGGRGAGKVGGASTSLAGLECPGKMHWVVWEGLGDWTGSLAHTLAHLREHHPHIPTQSHPGATRARGHRHPSAAQVVPGTSPQVPGTRVCPQSHNRLAEGLGHSHSRKSAQGQGQRSLHRMAQRCNTQWHKLSQAHTCSQSPHSRPHRRAYTQTATDAPTHTHLQTHVHTYSHPSPGDTCAGVCPHAHSLSHRHMYTQTRIFAQTWAYVLTASCTLTGHARTDSSAGTRVHTRAQTHRKCTWGRTPGDRLTDPHVHAHAHLGTPSHVHTHHHKSLQHGHAPGDRHRVFTHGAGTSDPATPWCKQTVFSLHNTGTQGTTRASSPQMNKQSPAPSQPAKMPPRMGPPHTNMCGLCVHPHTHSHPQSGATCHRDAHRLTVTNMQARAETDATIANDTHSSARPHSRPLAGKQTPPGLVCGIVPGEAGDLACYVRPRE